MKRINLETLAPAPHFIGSWFIEPFSLCNEITNYFDSHQAEQTRGKTNEGLDIQSKNSTDVTIRPRDLGLPELESIRKYVELLYACHQDYLEQWPFLRSILPRVEIGSFNIQRYQPGEHFRKVHAERGTIATSHRLLAWMTYLNDVEDGGSTYFTHQDLDIQPQKGKTLIWPAEWTHAHMGNVVNSGSKYVITGWMYFPRREKF